MTASLAGLFVSDDEIERNDCRRRETPCGIIGKHTHGDRVGVFVGEPFPDGAGL